MSELFQKSEVTGQQALFHSSPQFFVQRDQKFDNKMIVQSFYGLGDVNAFLLSS